MMELSRASRVRPTGDIARADSRPRHEVACGPDNLVDWAHMQLITSSPRKIALQNRVCKGIQGEEPRDGFDASGLPTLESGSFSTGQIDLRLGASDLQSDFSMLFYSYRTVIIQTLRHID